MNRLLLKKVQRVGRLHRKLTQRTIRQFSLLDEEEKEYWSQAIDRIEWSKRPENLIEKNDQGFYQWFPDGELNLTYNCLDSNLEKLGNQWAIIYDSSVTDDSGFITYKQLHRKVNKFAGVLKNLGIQKGDSVVLYLPEIPEAATAYLALWRIGAIPVPVDCAYGEAAIVSSINNTKPKLIITASCLVEGDRIRNIKKTVDLAREASNLTDVKTLVIQRDFKKVKKIKKGLDFEYQDLANQVNEVVDPIPVSSSHPAYYYGQTQPNLPGEIFFVRDTGGLAVGLKESLKTTFATKRMETILFNGYLSWDSGLHYSLLAPLMCGMKTVLDEGYMLNPEKSSKMVEKYSVNYIIANAHKVKQLFVKEGGAFPGEDYNLESLKEVHFFNGELSQAGIDNMKSNTSSDCEYSSHLYSSSVGVMCTGGSYTDAGRIDMKNEALHLMNIFASTDTEPTDHPTSKPLIVKSPSNPAAFVGFLGEKTEETGALLDKFIDENLNFRLPYKGRFDEEGRISLDYDSDERDILGNLLDLDKIDEIIEEFELVEECRVFTVSSIKKGLRPAALIYVNVTDKDKAYDTCKEIKKEILKQIGEVAELKEVFYITELTPGFSWRRAAKLISDLIDNTEDLEKISKTDKETYVEIFNQLEEQ